MDVFLIPLHPRVLPAYLSSEPSETHVKWALTSQKQISL